MKINNITSGLTVANAIELATGAAHQIMPELAKMLGASEITRIELANLVAARINVRLMRSEQARNGGAK